VNVFFRLILIVDTSLYINREGHFSSEFSLKGTFRKLFSSFVIRVLIENILLITTELDVVEYVKKLTL
jgi:hypothetical protein